MKKNNIYILLIHASVLISAVSAEPKGDPNDLIQNLTTSK